MRNLYTLQKSLLRSSFKKRRLDTCSCSTAKSFSTSTTADGTRQFFEWLEKSFGGNLPMDESNSRSAEVLTSSKKIQLDDLQRLFNHDALAIHVKDFYPQSSAIQLANELAMEQDHAQNWKVSTAHGLESSDVLTLGATPYNMAVAKSKSDDDRSSSLDDYYEQVTQEFENRRRRQQGSDETSKMVWPLDQLRLELDEVWPSGAGLARNPQNPQQCKSGGLTRITKGPTRWKQGFIHVDEMAPLSSASGYFSANIYLQLPNNDNGNKSKGEPVLDIWPLGIRNRWDWYKNANTLASLTSQDAEGQIRLRKSLGRPVQMANVEPGDLILLCVQRPHAAAGFPNSDIRISLQCFLQYSGKNQPLLIEA